jgi:hypothetical protein
MNSTATRRWDRDSTWVALLACCASILAFTWYLLAGDLLLYGDAVAHINIARRVFDSRTPGLLQLGTVWLPLPHLLTMPLIVNRALWQTGIGGSLPSMAAYVFAVVGIFRLTRDLAHDAHLSASAARLSAWASAVIFGLNPNLLYMQATAMTEALYLALFIWAVVHFADFVRGEREGRSRISDRARRSLVKSGLCVAGACLTRYDGWFLAASLCAVLTGIWWRKGSSQLMKQSLIRFGLLAAAIPVLWLAYNAAVYRNPLEFANGPYSAKAIEARTATPDMPSHPGSRNLATAAAYFVKSGAINLAESWLQLGWLAFAFVGSIVIARSGSVALLLWVPVPFYALSVAYSGVPIFMPTWFPYSAYNVRYGLQLLPAFAVFTPLAIAWIAGRTIDNRLRSATLTLAAVFVVVSYAAVWRATPVCYLEAWINSRTRLALETRLAERLRALPPNASFLMFLGGHVGALQDAGIPIARSVNEGNHRVWVQPSDPEGLWERSLANPSANVDYVVAIEGDPVADAMRTQNLPAIAHIAVDGQPSATLYRAR